MIFEQILVGGCYHVVYKDPFYPCDCVCHEPGSDWIHCFPCCRDHSYDGEGVCIAKNMYTGFVAIAINNRRFLCLRAYSVKRQLYKKAAMPGCPDVPMTNYDIFCDIPAAMIERAREEIARC